jgi:hypothetical protein
VEQELNEKINENYRKTAAICGLRKKGKEGLERARQARRARKLEM